MTNWFDDSQKNTEQETHTGMPPVSGSELGKATERETTSDTPVVPTASTIPVPPVAPATGGGWQTPSAAGETQPAASQTAAEKPIIPPTGSAGIPAGSPSTPPAGSGSYWAAPAQQSPFAPAGQTPPAASGGWQPTPPSPGQTPPHAPKKKHGMAVLAAVLGVLCVVSLCTSVVLAFHSVGSGGNTLTPGQTSGSNADATGVKGTPKVEISEPDENGLTTKEIIEKGLSSVVTLRIYTESQSFFGGSSGVLTESGVASGIVWTKDGYIITNCHCVINEKTSQTYPRIDVEMSDGTVYESVTVVGADESTDLAVMKIDSSKLKGELTPAEFGDSDAISMGDKVVALGNPGGIGLTATQGIVSGLTRDVYEDTGYAIPCIQIDAAINPGNSGGPLFNGAGQVIGINSSKIVATGYEGLGFSIPINEAKKVLDDLVLSGHVSGRVALGITGQTVTTTGYQGFYIATIEEGSCLKNTQIRTGDIIIFVDETRVAGYSELRSALATHQPGDRVTLKLLRFNEATRMFDQFEAAVTLGESTN